LEGERFGRSLVRQHADEDGSVETASSRESPPRPQVTSRRWLRRGREAAELHRPPGWWRSPAIRPRAERRENQGGRGGKTREEFQALMEEETLLRRLPTLAEVATVAAFMASDQANAMTATVANLPCGANVD
jgi:hypothetical protein